jgi:sulfite reductase (NADPH) flavoprotein alpha-component
MTNYDRKHPFSSYILQRTLLSPPEASKKTWLISLSLKGSSIYYQPGDSMAIAPLNHPQSVDEILYRIRWKELKDLPISIQDFFFKKANLNKPHPALIRRVCEQFPTADAEVLKSVSPASILSFYPCQLPSDNIFSFFLPLLPRLYSIVSSPLTDPEEARFLITLAEYLVDGRIRQGVASRFLCLDAKVHETPIEIFLQPARHFSLPSDPRTPIIMIGAGTGMAPFRAFMEHRIASNASGYNWFFLGERTEAEIYDRPFWDRLQQQNHLRLDLALSREPSQMKTYVQHRMWERRKELWQWILGGAFIYVCGNAKTMAKGVDEMLHQIVASEGNDARRFIAQLRQTGRYCRDIY